MAISLPRIVRRRFLPTLSRSSPLKIASPRTIRPGGCGISPRIDIVLTLLPEPDSPTMPSVSPGYRSYDTPSTACTIPSSVLNSTTRSRIERTGSGTDAALCGIEGVAETVADEVDAEDDDDDHQAGEGDEPPFVEARFLPLVQQGPQSGRGRPDAET